MADRYGSMQHARPCVLHEDVTPCSVRNGGWRVHTDLWPLAAQASNPYRRSILVLLGHGLAHRLRVLVGCIRGPLWSPWRGAPQAKMRNGE